jgi:poly(A) polymerase
VADPVIVPRADHPISRKDIDSDALRVLYRLHQGQHAAYLVGGSVRDLILGRRPKDFDIGTSAHPYQIKRLFRNCWIIGRRFRLAHIKFGTKTIEVATFRKNIPDVSPDAEGAPPPVEEPAVVATSPADPAIIHRDNTFGTPEEDAFRRDFTINGLFYDIATFSVIDFVGGLGDLERRVIRSIGDPHVRFVEDPVRMLRAAVLGARLGFDLDEPVLEAIARHRSLILKASPARLMEEYYKILRSGSAESSFRALKRLRLLELMTPEVAAAGDSVWESLARLDTYRQRFPEAPPELTNTILVGSLLVPMGALTKPNGPHHARTEAEARHDRVSFGMLAVAKKDLERLKHLLMIVPKLTDPDLPPRVARGLAHRPAFIDALSWSEIFGEISAATIAHWHHQRHQRPPAPSEHEPGEPPADQPPGQRRRRRRRRRRGRGPRPPQPPQ